MIDSSYADDAKKHHKEAMKRVSTNPEVEGQKFPIGCRVRICDDLGSSMRHFNSGCNATVEYTYAQAYGGTDTDLYSLKIDNYGQVSWYHEWQLTEIKAENCPLRKLRFC